MPYYNNDNSHIIITIILITCHTNMIVITIIISAAMHRTPNGKLHSIYHGKLQACNPPRGACNSMRFTNMIIITITMIIIIIIQTVQ